MIPEPRTYPVTVTGRPDGADLVVAPAHYEHLMHDLFDVLEQRPELLDDLVDLIQGDSPNYDPHMPDRPSRDDVLAEALVAALPAASRTIRLHRNPLAVLTASLNRLARRGWFPTQRGRVA